MNYKKLYRNSKHAVNIKNSQINYDHVHKTLSQNQIQNNLKNILLIYGIRL